MGKKTSVVIPVYKVEKYIRHTMIALINQTYRDFEIILVDDGTPDESISLAESVLIYHDLPYKVIHQKNSGLGNARNTGLMKSQGEWIYFLDSDDIILPHTLERLVEVAEMEQPDVVFSNYEDIYGYSDTYIENDKCAPVCIPAEKLQTAFLYRKLILLAPGTLYKKSFLVENNLLFEMIPWSEDQHFVWRVLSCITRAYYINESLYKYFRHENSIMTATPIEKMINSYREINNLPLYYLANKEVKQFIVPRWVMGTINAATYMNSYDDWKKLIDALDYGSNFKMLLKFKDPKVVMAAGIGIISPKLYYNIIKIKTTHK